VTFTRPEPAGVDELLLLLLLQPASMPIRTVITTTADTIRRHKRIFSTTSFLNYK